MRCLHAGTLLLQALGCCMHSAALCCCRHSAATTTTWQQTLHIRLGALPCPKLVALTSSASGSSKAGLRWDPSLARLTIRSISGSPAAGRRWRCTATWHASANGSCGQRSAGSGACQRGQACLLGACSIPQHDQRSAAPSTGSICCRATNSLGTAGTGCMRRKCSAHRNLAAALQALPTLDNGPSHLQHQRPAAVCNASHYGETAGKPAMQLSTCSTSDPL